MPPHSCGRSIIRTAASCTTRSTRTSRRRIPARSAARVRRRARPCSASENDRGTPGTGQVDWDATFDALREIGYNGWVVIEAFGDSLPDLAAATKIWRRTFSSEEQLARDGAAFLRPRLEQLAH